MKSHVILAAVAALVSFSALAAPNATVVKCNPENDVKDVARFKLNARGAIIFWNPIQIAKAELPQDKSVFFWLIDTRGNEGMSRGTTKSGYTTVRVVTTADATTVGIKVSEGKGYVRYEDYGSGSGNSYIKLVCSKE